MESEQFANLRLQRSKVDVWGPQRWWKRVADDPIALSLIPAAGAALLLYESTRRRSEPSFWWFVGGAIAGCVAAVSLGMGQRRRHRSPADTESSDSAMRESIDSFPASDAPSSTATTATAQPLHSGLA